MSYVYDGESIRNQRNVNMDSLIIKKRKLPDTILYLLAVCDGVGSLEDGAFAASQTIRKLDMWFDFVQDTRRLAFRFRDTLEMADRQIYQESQRLGLSTACTLSALLMDEREGCFYLAHTGDSRIYTYQDGELTQLTVDQKSNGRLISYICRPYGAEFQYVDGSLENRTFLLCSDGLYKRTPQNILERELAVVRPERIRKTIRKLINYAIQQGERDNISVALIVPRHHKEEI